jgi:ribulose-5-phosphate 4-epimerase/fuculose-1-phosphate aldolase
MTTQESMKEQWLRTRDRLVAKKLLRGDDASLSVRCPGGGGMWFGTAEERAPVLVDWRDTARNGPASAHAIVHARRADVGAVAWGGGPFGACLADFGDVLPQVFDEQARHIGPMGRPAWSDTDLAAALDITGNALLLRGQPMCLGTTCTRLALNAELFEKCAKAYVLAAAAGGRVKELPWLVRRIANGRLVKDERRAAQAFGRGELPVESSGY